MQPAQIIACFLKTTVLTYNLHILQFVHLKRTTQCFHRATELCATSNVLLRLSAWSLMFSLAARACPWVSMSHIAVKGCA